MAVTSIPKGCIPESWCCVDCNVNTAPGLLNRIEMERAFKSELLSASGEQQGVPMKVDEWSEVYAVREAVWKQAGMKPFGGCLCIGCVEKRLGRQLTPKDFMRGHAFNSLPGTECLLSRRDGA
jgi:hypothetical protein